MKKIIMIALISMLFISKANAQDLYYINSNGVCLTEQEYNKISEFYWDGYQKNLSLDDYSFLKENGLFENNIESLIITNTKEDIMPLAEHTTSNKSLKMSKSCSTNCLISISLNWLNLPKIRSYDILGTYLDNTSVIQVNDVIVETNKEAKNYSYTKKDINGIGTSFPLPTSGNALKISQTMLVQKKGNIKASYQHAKKNISYSNSNKYNFSKSGVGGVFNFNASIQSYYDCMLGVEFSLS